MVEQRSPKPLMRVRFLLLLPVVLLALEMARFFFAFKKIDDCILLSYLKLNPNILFLEPLKLLQRFIEVALK